jgi:SAM-dependent methyltransferase
VKENFQMSEEIKNAVRDRYGAVARSGLSNENEGAAKVAEAFGYSSEELSSIPAEANMGLSCGNPTALASLHPGDVVVDLGSGGGLDVFLAAQKVGPNGRAIGIDMTADMIERATRNAAKAGLTNVEFHLAEIEAMPLPDSSADVVISNCVLNLVPNKDRAFAEIFRILKPGGRLVASDIALKQPLPQEVSEDLLAYVGCVAGAILIEEYRQRLENTGCDGVELTDSKANLNAYATLGGEGCCSSLAEQPSELAVSALSCCGPSQDSIVHQELADLIRRYDINDFAASVRVLARKPMS